MFSRAFSQGTHPSLHSTLSSEERNRSKHPRQAALQAHCRLVRHVTKAIHTLVGEPVLLKPIFSNLLDVMVSTQPFDEAGRKGDELAMSQTLLAVCCGVDVHACIIYAFTTNARIAPLVVYIWL